MLDHIRSPGRCGLVMAVREVREVRETWRLVHGIISSIGRVETLRNKKRMNE